VKPSVIVMNLEKWLKEVFVFFVSFDAKRKRLTNP